ncbi:MAG: aminoglycoside phosphotransferase family protein, partial [Chloroflexi bacterium]|nr:aminoglycoside phosphotransferase family protein [Chloroflexota bacterium]
MGNPPATGQRVHWPDVPDRVRRAIEDRIGDRVVRAVTQSTGFSPGLAAILETGGGQRVFVKALGPELNPDSPGIHRREAGIVSRLPADVPV